MCQLGVSKECWAVYQAENHSNSSNFQLTIITIVVCLWFLVICITGCFRLVVYTYTYQVKPRPQDSSHVWCDKRYPKPIVINPAQYNITKTYP